MFDPNDKFHVYCRAEKEPYEETEFLDNSLGYVIEQAQTWLHNRGGGHAEFYYNNDEKKYSDFLFVKFFY